MYGKALQYSTVRPPNHDDEDRRGSGAEGKRERGVWNGGGGGHDKEKGVPRGAGARRGGGRGWRYIMRWERDETYSFWSAFRIKVEHIRGLIVVILISAVKGGVSQVCHSKKVDCGGGANWLCRQEAVHLTEAR